MRLLIFFLIGVIPLFATPLCQDIFPSAAGTTNILGGINDCVTINSAGRIYGSTTLTTAGFCGGANYGTCENATCLASGSNTTNSISLPTRPPIPTVTYTALSDINTKTTLNINSNTNYDHITVNAPSSVINLNNSATLNVGNGIIFNSNSTMNINGASTLYVNNGITLNSNATLNVNGNAIIDTTALTLNKGTININGNVVIYADSATFNTVDINIISGSLQIYVYNSVALNTHTSLNANGSPSSVILATTGTLTVNSSPNSFYGYAVGSVTVNSNGSVIGGVTGSTVTVNGTITYSNDFSNVSSNAICNPTSNPVSQVNSFNAWEKLLTPSSAKIYSKYAGQTFALKIGALDINGIQTPSTDVIKIYAVNSSSSIYLGEFGFGGLSEIETTFQINEAYRSLYLKFVNTNAVGACANGCYSSDFFSVRPAYLNNDSSLLNVIAGNNFNLTVSAKNSANITTQNYNGIIESSLNRAGKSGCTTIDALNSSNKQFGGGILNLNASLNDVGSYYIQDSIWLAGDECVAASSSNVVDSAYKIGCLTSMNNQIASSLHSFLFSNIAFTDSSRGYTFFLKDSSDMLSFMQAGITGSVNAMACSNDGLSCGIAQNYSSGCYANQNTLLITLPTKNGLTLVKQDSLTSSIAKDLGFANGVLPISNFAFNYVSSSASPVSFLEVNASNVILTITDPTLSITAQSTINSFVNGAKEIFLYARLNVGEQICYTSACNLLYVWLEEYLPNTTNFSLVSMPSISSNDWRVVLLPDSSNFSLNFTSGFTQNTSLSSSGYERTFGLSASSVPSTAIVYANTQNATWLKYKNNLIGKVIFKGSPQNGWSGFGNRNKDTIDSTNGISVEKINK